VLSEQFALSEQFVLSEQFAVNGKQQQVF